MIKYNILLAEEGRGVKYPGGKYSGSEYPRGNIRGVNIRELKVRGEILPGGIFPAGGKFPGAFSTIFRSGKFLIFT